MSDLTLDWRGQTLTAKRPTFAALDIRFLGDLCDVFFAEAKKIREAEERASAGDAVTIARATRLADDAAREIRERAALVAAHMGLAPVMEALAGEETDAAASAIEFVAVLTLALKAGPSDRGKSSPPSTPAS